MSACRLRIASISTRSQADRPDRSIVGIGPSVPSIGWAVRCLLAWEWHAGGPRGAPRWQGPIIGNNVGRRKLARGRPLVGLGVGSPSRPPGSIDCGGTARRSNHDSDCQARSQTRGKKRHGLDPRAFDMGNARTKGSTWRRRSLLLATAGREPNQEESSAPTKLMRHQNRNFMHAKSNLDI